MTNKPHDLDNLTRSLLEGTAEKPSASLNLRIMELIRKESCLRKAKSQPDGIRGLLTGFAIYFLTLAVIIGLGYTHDATSLTKIFETFPRLRLFLLTAGSSAMFFFFFTQLNNYLLWKKKREK